MTTATSSRLRESLTVTSLQTALKKNHDIWVKNNLPKSRKRAGIIIFNVKETEGEPFVVEIGPGKATNLSVQASDAAIQQSTELRRLIYQGDVLILDQEQIENLSDDEIHTPGDYLKQSNPYVMSKQPSTPRQDANPLPTDMPHPRLTGMAVEFDMLKQAAGGDEAQPLDYEQIRVDMMLDELQALGELLTANDFDFIRQRMPHPAILKWVDKQTPA